MPGLSNAVRAYRYKKLADFMRERGLDAVSFSSNEWFEWASNNEIGEQPWERPFALVVTASGRSFAVTSEFGEQHFNAATGRGSLWLQGLHHYAEMPERAGLRRTLQQWPEIVADVLAQEGLAKARIGLDSANNPITRAASRLPDMKFVDARVELRQLRWVKHPDEIEMMRRAASLCDWVMAQYREELAPGRLVAEVDYQIAAKLISEVSRRLPGENFILSGLSTRSGAASVCPKGDGVTSGKIVERDTIASTSLGVRLNGMTCELVRPWLLGSPSQEAVTMLDSALEAQQASIEAAVAGRPVCGIHAAAFNVFKRAGFADFFTLRAGHGIGVIMHDFPEDVPFCERSLLAGETYAIEPTLYVPKVGAFIFSDTLVIGANKAERLTSPTTRARQTLN